MQNMEVMKRGKTHMFCSSVKRISLQQSRHIEAGDPGFRKDCRGREQKVQFVTDEGGPNSILRHTKMQAEGALRGRWVMRVGLQG